MRFARFPVHRRRWPETFAQSINPVLFLFRGCLRRLLRFKRYLGSSTIRCRQCCGICPARTAHLNGRHRPIWATGRTGAHAIFTKTCRPGFNVGRGVLGRTPGLTYAMPNQPVWTPPTSRDEGALLTVGVVCSRVSGLAVALVGRGRAIMKIRAPSANRSKCSWLSKLVIGFHRYWSNQNVMNAIVSTQTG